MDKNAPQQEEELVVEKAKKLEILPGADESVVTCVVAEEDHTLGNALRYILMRNPDVEFCGYSVPHPSEDKMNVRIQARKGKNATEQFRKGLTDLISICEHTLLTFESEMSFVEEASESEMDT
ncbi:RNA polymerase subunit AC19 [Balamuthia mandrillaris]